MEIKSLQPDSTSRREPVRVSSFETEPREFRKWLSDSGSERRIRIDIPVDSNRVQSAKSIYGVCQPIETVGSAKRNNPQVIDSSDKQQRLVRLLEKQQEWYDARQVALSRAENYLALIDQHQQLWLNNQLSTKQENS